MTVEKKKESELERPRLTFVSHSALAGLIVGAVLLRIGLAFYLPRIVKFDETTYLEIARNLVTGQGLVRGMYRESGYVELLHPPLQSIVLIPQHRRRLLIRFETFYSCA